MCNSLSNVPTIPQDPNMGAAQFGAMGSIGSLGQYQPQYQSAYYNQANNPYQGQAMQGAFAAGNAAINQGQGNLQSASYFQGVPQQLQPAIAATLQTAYDPQQNLYQSQLQSAMDKANVFNANAGLSTSPYGVGLMQEAQQNFDTNWLQSQLGRETQGAQTINSLLGASGTAATAGANLGTTGAQQILAGYGQPYTTSSGINQQTASMLPYLTALPQQQAQDYMAYYGAANQNTANQIAAGSAQDKSLSGLGQGLGSLLGGIGSLARLF